MKIVTVRFGILHVIETCRLTARHAEWLAQTPQFVESKF